MSSVLLVAEHQKQKLKNATLNALTFARQMAEKHGAQLNLLVIGNGVAGVADQLKPYGADVIYLVDDPSLANYTAETWGYVVAEVAKQINAIFVGMNSGTTGRDLIPRVAAKLGAGMVTDLIGFEGK